MESMRENQSFEEALAELESTIAQLEAGNLSLESSLALFERGQALAEYCNSLLDRAQLKVELLTENGEIVTMAIDPES